MKRIIHLLLTLLLILSLVACGNQAVSDDDSVSDDTQSEQEIVENSKKPTTDSEPAGVADEDASTEVVTGNKVASSEDANAFTEEQVHEHQYTSKVVPQTCYEDGYTLHTCSCGDSYKDNTTPKLPHLYCEKVVSPTATAQGYTKYTCIHCGDTYNSNDSPTTGTSSSGNATTTSSTPTHTCNYVVDSVVPGNCTTKGYTVYVCSCGDSYKDDYSGGKGHKWGDVYEEVPVYETVCITRCGYCHAALSEVGGLEHIKEEAMAGNGSRSYQSYEQVYVGTEVQIVGSKCSVCGADY